MGLFEKCMDGDLRAINLSVEETNIKHHFRSQNIREVNHYIEDESRKLKVFNLATLLERIDDSMDMYFGDQM